MDLDEVKLYWMCIISNILQTNKWVVWIDQTPECGVEFQPEPQPQQQSQPQTAHRNRNSTANLKLQHRNRKPQGCITNRSTAPQSAKPQLKPEHQIKKNKNRKTSSYNILVPYHCPPVFVLYCPIIVRRFVRVVLGKNYTF